MKVNNQWKQIERMSENNWDNKRNQPEEWVKLISVSELTKGMSETNLEKSESKSKEMKLI